MPTLLTKNRFKFFFYANEHEPRHVHVMKSGGFAKIELFTLKVTRNTLKPAELKKALALVKQYQHSFAEVWNEHFKRQGRPF